MRPPHWRTNIDGTAKALVFDQCLFGARAMGAQSVSDVMILTAEKRLPSPVSPIYPYDGAPASRPAYGIGLRPGRRAALFFFWSNGKGGQEGQAGASDQLTDDEFGVADGQIGTDRLFPGSQVAVQHQTVAGIPLGQNKGLG